MPDGQTSTGSRADVVAVSAQAGTSGSTFSVTVRSPDSGCEAYADWWEVTSINGELLYRRILAHSHVNEQPFVRTGGPVDVPGSSEVFVRAHFSTTGYGGQAFRGSIDQGFLPVDLAADFAAGLENDPPQPADCAF